MMAEAIHCSLCGSRHPETVYIHETGLSLWRCRDCGLLYFAVPDEERPDYWSTGGSRHNLEVYSDPAVLRADRARFHRYLERMEREIPKASRRLLDYGCGTGTFLECALERGWEACGLDISEEAVRRARSRGLPAWTLGEAPRELDAPFDAVTLWDVLEHLDDLHGTLHSLSSFLRAGGRLFVETPDARYVLRRWSLSLARWTRGRLNGARFFFYPDHRTYFSEATLSRLLDKHGFRVDWIGRTTTPPRKVVQKLRRVHRTAVGWALLAWIVLRLTRLLGGNKLLVCARISR